jgi:hypothetical protein
MKNTDKFLLAIVVGVVLLIVVAFAVVFTRPKPAYQSDDTPAGVVHNYLFALQEGNYERAYSYLSPSLDGYHLSLAAFLSPFLSNAYDFITNLLLLTTGGKLETNYYGRSPDWMRDDLAAMLVLSVLWFYHLLVARADSKASPETGGSAAVKSLYVYVFSATGLTMTFVGIIQIINWILFQFGSQVGIYDINLVNLRVEVARLIVGVPLWLFGQSADGRDPARVSRSET